jgi:ferredoxin
LPVVVFRGRSVECLSGANLRLVLLRARLPLYNDVARALNCRGRGLCGTCTVRIQGAVSPPTEAECKRLGLPPHHSDAGLRLACQANVLGDLEVTKLSGFFGTRAEKGGPSS